MPASTLTRTQPPRDLPNRVVAVGNGALWRELVALLEEDAPDTAFLRRAFALFCRGAHATEAAFYRQEKDPDTLHRFCSHGSGQFPEDLSEESLTGETLTAYRPVPLPQGVLLLPATAHEPEAECALLAAALQLQELRARVKRQSFRAKYRGVELEALYDVGLAITRTLELTQLTDEILSRAVSLLDARRGALYQLQGENYQLRQAIGGSAAPRVTAQNEDVAALLRTGRSPQPVEAPEPTDPDLASTLLASARFLAAVPIELDDQPWGLLVVGDKEHRHGVGPFSAADHRTLGLFGHHAAIAIANAQLHQQALEKERLERDMELAAEIQRQLLPEVIPDVPEYALGGWNRPARQVGGDYYDIRPLEDDRLLLVLGDVTGKGMPAALLVSTLHSALRLMVPRLALGPEFLRRLNEHLLEISPVNKFITLVLVDLDIAQGRLRYLNAGHNPALLLRRDGSVEELPAGGPPLGLLPDSSYRAAEYAMGVGDLLCLYSDGLTEATTPDDEEFGTERLAQLLDTHRQDTPRAIRATLETTLHRFTAGQPQGDDQTLILLRRDR
jgi:phosphoserine phosphatase RsbU/P